MPEDRKRTPRIQTVETVLPVGGRYPFDTSARYIRVISADVAFHMAFESDRPFKAVKGRAILDTVVPVKKVTLTAMPSQVAPNAIELVLSDVPITDDAVLLDGTVTINNGAEVTLAAGTSVELAAGSEVKTTVPATLETPNADYALLAATNTTVAAANASRKRLHVLNNGANAVRLSSSAAALTAGRGLYLRPYAEAEFEITGALSARAAGATTLVVSEEVFA